MINKKMMNIKIYEEDFNLIKVSIFNLIQDIRKNIDELDLDDKMKGELKNDIFKYRQLLSKLEICKLYNEDV